MSAKTTLSFSVFRFVCEPLNEIRMPVYAGATLRGAFGYALKHAVCVNIFGECELCILKQKCVYEVAFVTPRPTTSRIMHKYYQVPRPFVLSPPFADNKLLSPGEELVFKLTLVGKAIDYLPFFIYTFDALGKWAWVKIRLNFAGFAWRMPSPKINPSTTLLTDDCQHNFGISQLMTFPPNSITRK